MHCFAVSQRKKPRFVYALPLLLHYPLFLTLLFFFSLGLSLALKATTLPWKNIEITDIFAMRLAPLSIETLFVSDVLCSFPTYKNRTHSLCVPQYKVAHLFV